MKNPWSARWRTFKSYNPADRDEDIMMEMEAQEAEEMYTEKCGICGSTAYYRPGVGAWQCPECRALLVTKRDKETYEILGQEWMK